MENLETSGVKNLATEEAEPLTQAKPMPGLHLPRMESDHIYFPVDEKLSQYVVPLVDKEQQNLTQLLDRAEMPLADVYAALLSFKQAINNRTTTSEAGVMIPEATAIDYTVDFMPKYCLGVAAVLFLVFFILIILSSYYVDDSNLAYVAIVFVALGLFIHLCVILFNGDFRVCKKRLRLPAASLNPRQRRLVLGAIAIANKAFNKKFLTWKIGKDGNWVELSELAVQRSVSVKTPGRK